MYTAPHPLPRPSIAWPARILGLLSVSFLSWSLMLPWRGPGATPRVPHRLLVRGLHTAPGHLVMGAMSLGIIVALVLHRRPPRPSIRRLLIGGTMFLLGHTTLWSVDTIDPVGRHASTGLLWGGLLGIVAMGVVHWRPMRMTPVAPLAARTTSDLHPRHWDTGDALLLAALLILGISALVGWQLLQPVVIPFTFRPCACLYP